MFWEIEKDEDWTPSFVLNFMDAPEDISRGDFGAMVMEKSSLEYIQYCNMAKNGYDEGRERIPDVCLWKKEGRESNSLRGSGAKEGCFFPTLFSPFLYCLPQPPVSQPCRWCSVLSFPVMCDSLWTVAHQAPLSMGMLQAGILEWVATPSFRGSSQPRDWIQVSHIAGGFFTIWATREAQEYWTG